MRQATFLLLAALVAVHSWELWGLNRDVSALQAGAATFPTIHSISVEITCHDGITAMLTGPFDGAILDPCYHHTGGHPYAAPQDAIQAAPGPWPLPQPRPTPTEAAGDPSRTIWWCPPIPPQNVASVADPSFCQPMSPWQGDQLEPGHVTEWLAHRWNLPVPHNAVTDVPQ